MRTFRGYYRAELNGTRLKRTVQTCVEHAMICCVRHNFFSAENLLCGSQKCFTLSSATLFNSCGNKEEYWLPTFSTVPKLKALNVKLPENSFSRSRELQRPKITDSVSYQSFEYYESIKRQISAQIGIGHTEGWLLFIGDQSWRVLCGVNDAKVLSRKPQRLQN